MEFINQVKQLKDQTNSPEVRQICENYLNGGSKVAKEIVASLLNESSSALNENEVRTPVQNYREAAKNEELQVAKRMADSLMESWGGISKPTSNNAGAYLSTKKEEVNNAPILESLSNLTSKDASANSFMEAQGLKNLGVLESISKIKKASIYEHPRVKVICEQFTNLIHNKNVPEFILVDNFIAEANNFSWDFTVSSVVDDLKSKTKKFSREIAVSKVLESIKNSGSSNFYSELTDTLNSWLVSENKSTGLLAKNLTKWSFNPVVRNLVNYLNVNESSNGSLEIPVSAQAESGVSRIYAPVQVTKDKTIFAVGKNIFEANSEGLFKVNEKSISSDYLELLNASTSNGVRINENGVFVNLGRKSVRLIEENEEVSVYLDKSKLKFNSLGELGKMLSLELTSYLGVNESQAINNVITLYRGYGDIVELDFAKSIVSKIYEGASVNLIKWNDKIYLNRINEGMRENSFYQVNGSQAVKMVKEFLRYDISEGLTDFLEGESKVKSVMINDRNKVLENISKVEVEIKKLESLTESHPEISETDQIKAAYSILNDELSHLKEKWNQINVELDKINSNPETSNDLSEDKKFNIGSYIKVKESGETGKIISVNGTSGRYTVMLDNGKTSDLLVNEFVDLDQALNQASEENGEEGEEQSGELGTGETSDDNEDDNDSEEVKEARKYDPNQTKLLKGFAKSHGFAKAPGMKKGEIDIEYNDKQGYNLTMNEANGKTPLAKAPGDSKLVDGKEKDKKANLAEAPGNDKKVPGKTPGDKFMAKAPGGKPKVDFDGEDAAGDKYDHIGYNLEEAKVSKHGDMVEAPESGKNAKETHATASQLQAGMDLIEAPEKGKKPKDTTIGSALSKRMALAEAPGKEGNISFKTDKTHGYNLTESEELKKK